MLPPFFTKFLRKKNCEAAIDIQTTTAAIAAIDVKTRKTVSAANTLVSKDRLAKIRLKINAFSGTPFLVNFVNAGLAIPCFAIAHSIRKFAYRPELATDNTAVIITKFIISAAYGTPATSNTSTKGLSTRLASCHGSKPTTTDIAKTKKKRVRQIVFFIAFGIVFSGFSLSPEAIPINSVPWKE
ncbi:hypothetical protein BF15_02860 [Bacillus thuringiensis]|nr:hypothetical protein BF15_02860 [Bacillus thuringiensis]